MQVTSTDVGLILFNILATREHKNPRIPLTVHDVRSWLPESPVDLFEFVVGSRRALHAARRALQSSNIIRYDKK